MTTRTEPINEANAQRYAAELSHLPVHGQIAALGFPIFTYLNERTMIIHLCRSPHVAICGKYSKKNEWKNLPSVLIPQTHLVCTRCARRCWRGREMTEAAKRKIIAR